MGPGLPIAGTLLLIVSLMEYFLRLGADVNSMEKHGVYQWDPAPHNGYSFIVQNFTWDPIRKDITMTNTVVVVTIISHGKWRYTCV